MAGTKIRAQKATQILKEDHKNVRKLFAKYENLGDNARTSKAELFETIKDELTVHATIEEEIFYPCLEESEDPDARELVAEAHEEHEIVKTLLEELSVLEAGAVEFDAKMKVLAENVEHHAEEEESEIFPIFNALPRDRQDDVSEELRQRRIELTQDIDEDEG
jgi:iron-sulfur cluster repair protein YtfE (RIC family)